MFEIVFCKMEDSSCINFDEIQVSEFKGSWLYKFVIIFVIYITL